MSHPGQCIHKLHWYWVCPVLQQGAGPQTPWVYSGDLAAGRAAALSFQKARPEYLLVNGVEETRALSESDQGDQRESLWTEGQWNGSSGVKFSQRPKNTKIGDSAEEVRAETERNDQPIWPVLPEGRLS